MCEGVRLPSPSSPSIPAVSRLCQALIFLSLVRYAETQANHQLVFFSPLLAFSFLVLSHALPRENLLTCLSSLLSVKDRKVEQRRFFELDEYRK